MNRYHLIAIMCLALPGLGYEDCSEDPCQDIVNADGDGVIQTTDMIDGDWRDTPPGPFDPWDFAVDCHYLHLTVSYSGGCATHDFTLFGSTAFAESWPVQADIWVVHDTPGDPCLAYITEERVYDLTALGDAYREAYERDDLIEVNVRGADGRILYTFAYDTYLGM